MKSDNSCNNRCNSILKNFGLIVIPVGMTIVFGGIYLVTGLVLKDIYKGAEKGINTVVLKICLNHFAISSIVASFPLAWPAALSNILLAAGMLSGTSSNMAGISWSCIFNEPEHSIGIRPIHWWSLTV